MSEPHSPEQTEPFAAVVCWPRFEEADLEIDNSLVVVEGDDFGLDEDLVVELEIFAEPVEHGLPLAMAIADATRSLWLL